MAAFAQRERISFAAALARPDDVPGLAGRSAQAISRFNTLIDGLRELSADAPVAEVAEAVLDRSGYQTALEESTDLQDAILAKIDEIQHGNGVAGAVGDVGELSVAGGVAGEGSAMAGGEAEQGAEGRERKAAAR